MRIVAKNITVLSGLHDATRFQGKNFCGRRNLLSLSNIFQEIGMLQVVNMQS
jgi:hypothetical protein